MSEVPVTLIASVRQRLLNGSRARGEEFQLTLTRFAIERLLYRLGQSPHRDRFILKGAALFAVWLEESREVNYRTTRDVDFLGGGESSTSAMTNAFREIAATVVEHDGLTFDAESITAELMREDDLYEGCRLHLMARLGGARIPLQIDVGFGDVVTPVAKEGDYPTLLDFPPPRLRLYPRETVIAEKFEAMVSLGMANSRMKDFFDLWLLLGQFSYEGPTLGRALVATFEKRGTPLPDKVPLALTPQFAEDAAKIAAWKAFASRNALQVPELMEVARQLQDFLMPLTQAARAGSTLDNITSKK